MPNGAPSLEQAQSVVATALDLAREQRLAVAIAVVDRGGHVVAAARMDGVAPVNVAVAVKKANAAGTFGVPTRTLADGLHGGASADPIQRAALAATADQLLAVPGGFPLTELTTVVGGFGIAGVHYDQDHDLGQKTLKALATW